MTDAGCCHVILTPTETLSEKDKIEKIAFHFAKIMETLGLDLTDPSLQETPRRVAKMYVQEVFSGLNPDTFPTISTFPHQQEGGPQIVMTKVGFISFCEHHFVPMIGTAYVGYIPKDRVIGLSKISRIVRHYSRRPQLQERLTRQIAAALETVVGHDNIALVVQAQHLCVIARGVEDEKASTSTTHMRGLFVSSDKWRHQFFELIRHDASSPP